MQGTMKRPTPRSELWPNCRVLSYTPYRPQGGTVKSAYFEATILMMMPLGNSRTSPSCQHLHSRTEQLRSTSKSSQASLVKQPNTGLRGVTSSASKAPWPRACALGPVLLAHYDQSQGPSEPSSKTSLEEQSIRHSKLKERELFLTFSKKN